MWIEVFKGGLHKDSVGNPRFYNISTLQDIVDKYNSKVKSNSSNMVPLVKGHPTGDAPAYGWVEQLARNGYKVLAKIKDVSKDLLEEIREGKYKKVSVSLYPDLSLRHIGLLGASAPAVKGLQEINHIDFDEVEPKGGIISYTEFSNVFLKDNEIVNNDSKVNEFNEGIIAILLKENSELESENSKLKEQIKNHRDAFRKKKLQEFAESLNSSDKGYFMTNQQIEQLVEILELASSYEEEKEISQENSLVRKIMNFVSSSFETLNRDILFNGIQGQRILEEDSFSQKVVSPERWQMHLQAKQMIAENPQLSYEEAILLSQNI